MVLLDNIKIYCKNENISEKKFEELCGLSVGAVRKWRIGANRSATVETLEKIEKGTNIPEPKWITEGGIRERKHKQKN
jgi:transcriptional regulator with XRE-family HTH domain